MFTDTHCHLYLNYSETDLPAVLQRAWEANLTRIVVPGIDLATSRQAVALAERDPRIFAAIGVHPNEANTWDNASLNALRALAAHPKVVAIGEVGLDAYRDRVALQVQERALRDQLALAAETGLPVVIHCREARTRLWELLNAWMETHPAIGRPAGVLHAFDGTLAEAQESIAHGFYISFAGPLTFKSAAALQQVAAALPLDALLTETDSPYLTPHPYRGQRNEPAHVTVITEKLATLQHLPVCEVAQTTTQNAARLFQWNNAD